MNDMIFDARALAEFAEEKMRKVNLFESSNLFCDVYCLRPGQSQKPHTHADNDKIYFALDGNCHVVLGEETTPLAQGHVAIAPAGVVHGVENRSDEDATLLVVMAPNPNG